MIVTLIETYRIFNMTLPDKVKGRFWITDVDSFGNDRKLISVEADEGSWVLKGSDSAVICDTHNRIADDTVLEDNVFYNVRILEENEEGYVYAQPDDIGRQTFDKYVFRDNAELTIGRDSDNTVCINNRYVSSHHAVIKYMDGVWTIEDKNSTNGTFVNNRRTSLQELRPGDVLFIVGFKLIIGSNYIAFNNPGNTVKWDNNILQNMKPQEFDGVGKTKTTEIRPQFFYRAPRFKRDISTLKFKVDMPPAKEAQNNMPMAMIMGPSITMGMASMSSGAFSVINAINSGGNVMSVIPTAAMSVSMLLGMVMWPIITKKHEKKESQRCEAERQKLYKEYLFSLRDTIRREIENQEQILRENNISIDEASDRIINRLGNLWERNINQDDFLSISLGNGNIQMCEEIQFPDRKFSVNKDNLINDMFALANEPRELKSVPVIHGKDGVILDTLYLYVNGGEKKLPESQAELGGADHGIGIWTEDVGNRDIFGVGIIMGKSTKEDVEAYFGKPLYEKDTENGMVMQYNYKNTDIYVTFNFFKDTGKIRIIFIDGDKGLDTY